MYTSDLTEDDRSEKKFYLRYLVAVLIAFPVILAIIAATTQLPTIERGTLYVNKSIDKTLTKKEIYKTILTDKTSFYYFIHVNDYFCRFNDSLLSYAVLKGHVTPPSRIVTRQSFFLAKEITVQFCKSNTHLQSALVSVKFSSGCNCYTDTDCFVDSKCSIALERSLPLCISNRTAVSIEWDVLLRIRGVTTKTYHLFPEKMNAR